MGCSYPPRTLDDELKLELEENNIKSIPKENKNHTDISFLLYQKIDKFIKLNPFYKIPLSEFEDKINTITNNNNNSEIIDLIISTFFTKEESYVKVLFNKVIEYTLKNYDFGLNSENNNNLIIIIITFVYIFLTDNKQGKIDLFRKNILKMMEKKKANQDEIGNKYKKEDIYNLIINIIHMHTFFFKNFFLYFAFSEIFIDDNSDYKKIINEDSSINKINSFIETYINKINENLSCDFLNFLFISEVNNKIKSCFNIDNEDRYIIMDENKFNGMINSIYTTININNFISFIFFGENHIY